MPSNLDVAEVFLRIGDLLDYLDENTFKVRAYWHAAEVLRHLDEPLTEIAAKGELNRLRGVGEAIEDKVKEILETGQCKVYEDLKAEVSEGVRELLASSGIPPKLVRIAVQQLTVSSPLSLREAVLKADLSELGNLNQGEQAELLRAALAIGPKVESDA
jgi:DNA polymerase (family 10)